MKARFGRDIYCQECGEDDEIKEVWNGQFSYHYECGRCGAVVKEVDRNRKRDGGG